MSARPGLATGFSSEEESPGLLLWRVTNRWQAAQRATLKPFGLTHVQFVLLAALTWLGTDGPVTQRALAEHAGTDPMMTSQVVRVLADRQLVLRTPHVTDRRAWSVSATDAGIALANRAVVAVEACDRAFFGPLGPSMPAFTWALASLGSAAPSA
jgi:DNA-binding MarR family transcriptional regulator